MKILNPPNGFVSMHDPYTRLRGGRVTMRGAWASKGRRNGEYRLVCAWCGRVSRESGGWTAGITTGTVTHGMCPKCFAKHKPKGKKNG
jgi:hypothetical protein